MAFLSNVWIIVSTNPGYCFLVSGRIKCGLTKGGSMILEKPLIYSSDWDPDFPPVMHFIDPGDSLPKPWDILIKHPCYDAAKNHEDRNAALRLVIDFLDRPENSGQLHSLSFKFPDAIIVPIHAIEAHGENKIPEMLAEYMSNITGLEVDNNIVQTNRVHRTGSDEIHRFAFRPTFEGDVKKNKPYILVDDVFAFGGSFNELRIHIEKNCGKVVQTAAMSLGGHGNKIAPEHVLLKKLIDRHSLDSVSLFLKEINLYGGNYKALTNPEAYFLGKTRSLNEARDRILEAKQAGRPYLGTERTQENKALKIKRTRRTR